MIYLDSSVALAYLLAEDERPSDALWQETLLSSRLLEYEIWTRLHARRLGASHGESARLLLNRVAFLEMVGPVLARVLDPFPAPVRTLDAFHLASADFVRAQGQDIAIASYDDRLNAAAKRMGFRLAKF